MAGTFSCVEHQLLINSFVPEEPIEEVVRGSEGNEPFLEDQKIVNLIREDNEFVIDVVCPQGLNEPDRLGKGHVPVVEPLLREHQLGHDR